jgi:hypothetical protein
MVEQEMFTVDSDKAVKLELLKRTPQNIARARPNTGFWASPNFYFFYFYYYCSINKTNYFMIKQKKKTSFMLTT